MNNQNERIKAHLLEAGEVLISSADLTDQISQVARLVIERVKNGGTVFWCGNGGSAADAQHLAAELIGKYKHDRMAIPSIALTTDTSALTAISNDFGYEHVFARQLEGIGRDGDVLFAISTSGDSKNIVKVLEKAQSMDIYAILLTSAKCENNLGDVTIRVPSTKTEFIQHTHTAIGHILCELIEASVIN